MPTIVVRPLDGHGWRLDVEGVLNPQVFRSGAHAEAAAKALAKRLVTNGAAAPIVIQLRDGSNIAAGPP